MTPPLHGLRIVELGTMIAVPAATQLLASYGAQVIKVEDTGIGDPLRFYGSQRNGMSGWFANVNSGKRSIAIELKVEAGKALLWQLLASADVLIEGFRPGVMEKLGFGYQAVNTRLPNLIYCSSSGFGDSGPYAQEGAYDPLIQALTGWAGAQLMDQVPTLIRGMVADKVGAWNNAQSIMAAIIRRERTGESSHIVNSMLDGNLAFNWPDLMMHCTLQDHEGVDHRPNLLQTYRLYNARDGFVSLAVGTDKQWQAMCETLEKPDMAFDPRFVSGAQRAINIVDWYNTMDAMVATLDVEEVVAKLKAADVPVAPVYLPDEVAADPQVQAAGLVQTSQHPQLGAYQHTRSRSAVMGSDIELQPAPSQGEHSLMLLEELGYSAESIEGLIAEGAVQAS